MHFADTCDYLVLHTQRPFRFSISVHCSIMSSSFSSQPRPLAMSGFSQPLRPPTSEGRNTATTSASSNNLNKWQGASNIWSTSFNSSSSTALPTPGPRNSLSFGTHNGKLSGKDTIEGRSGSSQLIESSVSDEYSAFRSASFSKRDDANRLGGPLPKTNDVTFPQDRSNSNSGLPQAYAGAARGSMSFSTSSRPATSGISSTTSMAPKTQLSGTFDSPLSYSADAPSIYTKFDRANKPATSRPTDSAYGEWIDGGSMTQSPVDERRRPSAAGYFHGLPSAPPSRNHSLPPSRHSDVQPAWPNLTKADQFSSSQAPSTSFRVNSLSSTSRPNGSFGAADAQLPALTQFSQMSLHDDSQNFALSRPSFSMPTYAHQQGHSGIESRNSSADQYDDVEQINRVPPTSASDAYHPATQLTVDYSAYRMPQYPERSMNSNMYNPRNANSTTPNFANQRYQQPSPQDLDPRYLLSLPYSPVPGGYYSYHLPNGSAIHNIPAVYPPMHPQMSMNGAPSMLASRGPRELESGHSLRSALLEDFKQNHKTRRYELKVLRKTRYSYYPFTDNV